MTTFHLLSFKKNEEKLNFSQKNIVKNMEKHALEILPLELWIKILSYPRAENAHGVARIVCKTFYDILHDKKKTYIYSIFQNIDLLNYSLRYFKPIPHDQSYLGMIAHYHGARMVHLMHTKYGFPKGTLPIATLAIRGDTLGILFLRRRSWPWDRLAVHQAIQHKHNETYYYLLENGCPHNGHFEQAVKYGNVEIAKFALPYTPVPKDKITRLGVLSGSIEMLEWLDGACLFQPSPELMKYGARQKNVEMLEWLRKRKCYSYSRLSEYLVEAAKYNRLNNMRWFISQGAEWTSEVIVVARRSKRIINYAVKNGCPLPD